MAHQPKLQKVNLTEVLLKSPEPVVVQREDCQIQIAKEFHASCVGVFNGLELAGIELKQEYAPQFRQERLQVKTSTVRHCRSRASISPAYYPRTSSLEARYDRSIPTHAPYLLKRHHSRPEATRMSTLRCW